MHAVVDEEDSHATLRALWEFWLSEARSLDLTAASSVRTCSATSTGMPSQENTHRVEAVVPGIETRCVPPMDSDRCPETGSRIESPEYRTATAAVGKRNRGIESILPRRRSSIFESSTLPSIRAPPPRRSTADPPRGLGRPPRNDSDRATKPSPAVSWSNALRTGRVGRRRSILVSPGTLESPPAMVRRPAQAPSK